MSVTTAAPRRHHTDLRPLTTRSDTPIDPTRRKSIQSQGSPPTKSTARLPSPSIVAARAYYLELALPVGPEDNADERRKSLIEGQQVPRRHSVLTTMENLVSQLESFTFASGGKDLVPVSEGHETEPKTKTEDVDVSLNEVEECTAGVEKVRQSSTLLCGTPQEILRQVPFQYTHDHLRDWGYAYLGNSETADAFVNAVSLRRPSLALVKEEFQVKATASEMVTIRARVLPKAKERKPFLIQRQFNIDELRLSIPKARVSKLEEEGNSSRRPKRSSRVRRSSTWQSSGEIKRKGNGKTPISERPSTLGHGPVPIHIEYALHYLPVLAALMLSGHVRKGDTIDLPIPHPEAWRETITYIYTGRAEPGTVTKENISYLAGYGD